MNTIFAMTDNNMRSKLIKNIALIRFLNVLLAVLIFSCQFTSGKSIGDTPYRIKTIVVDAGHGGDDGATKGLFSREKDVALQVALRLGKAIEENIKDVKVIYTRTTDVFVPALVPLVFTTDAVTIGGNLKLEYGTEYSFSWPAVTVSASAILLNFATNLVSEVFKLFLSAPTTSTSV